MTFHISNPFVQRKQKKLHSYKLSINLTNGLFSFVYDRKQKTKHYNFVLRKEINIYFAEQLMFMRVYRQILRKLNCEHATDIMSTKTLYICDPKHDCCLHFIHFPIEVNTVVSNVFAEGWQILYTYFF